MIYFLLMPTKSILIGSCDDSEWKEKINKVRHKYEPHIFLKKICSTSGNDSELKRLTKLFAHLRIKSTYQFEPGDELIDYINTCNPPYKKMAHVPNYSQVQESIPPNFNEPIELELPRHMQDGMLMEGAHQGENPCEILREIIGFYLDIRSAVRSKQDPASKIEQFNKYLLIK